MSVLSQIKSAFRKVFGGGSKSSSKSRSSYSRQSTTRASRVSNYGGGGSRSYRDYSSGGYRSDYEDRQAAEQRRRQEQEQKRQATTNALASISKRTDSLSSGRSPSVASSATSTGNGTARVLAKISEKSKAAPPDPKVAQVQKSRDDAADALKSLSKGMRAKAPEEMVKSGDYEYRPKANNMNTPSADSRSTTRLTLQGYKKRMSNDTYRKAESFARGAGGDATFGAVDVLMHGNKNDKTEQEIEKYYQENKSKGAEGVGRLVGSLMGFGMSGSAATSLAKEVAPNFVKKGGRKAVEQLVKSPAFRKAAAKEAEKAGLKLTDDVIERFALQRATRIVNAVGSDIAINWTTGGLMDVNYAIRDTYDENDGNFDAKDFAKNLAKNRAYNYGVGGLVTVVPALRTQKGLLREGLFGTNALKTAARDDAAELARSITNGQTARKMMFDRAAEANDALSRAAKGEDAVDIRKLVEGRTQRSRDMRNAVLDRANEADEAVRRGFSLPSDRVKVSTTDPTVTDVGIRQLADATKTVRNAKRAAALDDLLTNARKSTAIDAGGRKIDLNSPAVDVTRLANANRIKAIDNELDAVQREILLKRNTASEAELDALNNRFTELLNERNALENAVAEAPAVRNIDAGERNVIEETGSAPMTEAPQARAEATQPRTETPQAEPQTANTNAENARPTLQEIKETQTQKESEDLLKAHFDETGEADLGKYGQITQNSDGTYKISIDGAGEKTLTREEAEKRIRDSVKRAYEKPRTVDSIEDVVYKRKERISFRKRLEKALASTRMVIADSLAPFEDAERRLAKAEHRQVDYGAINGARTHQAKANRSISNHQVNWLGDKFSGTVKRVGADGKVYEIENGKSLAEIYKGMDEATERDFDLYLELRHAPDRILQGKSVFRNIVDKRGLNFDDANVCRAEADRLLKEHPEFAKKAEEVYQYTQNELKNRVDAGLLTQKKVDEWNAMYPNYVPTGREGFNEIHGINGPTIGAEDIRGAKGSDRNIMSIRDQLSAATTRNWRDMTTNEMFRRYFGDRVAADLAQDADGGIERVLDNTINLGKSEETGKYFADVYINGKKHTVDIEDNFYDALKDLYKNGRIGVDLVDTTNEAFSRVANVWKSLITEWSPIFMVKNGMRDFPEAVINSRQSKEFIGSMGAARRDLLSGGPYSEALRDAGISQSTFIDLDKAIRAGKDKKGWLARLNAAVEMYPRLCEYMATLKKAGIDITDPNGLAKADKALRDRAAANAADVTVNFGRSGSIGKALNKGLVPFFNPSVQGWSKFVRNITERDLRSADGLIDTLSFLTKATAFGAGANTLNNFLLQDNPNYQMISARDKANNYIIPWPPTSNDTDTFVKIPKSRFASVYGLPSVNAFNDNKMGYAEMFKIANDQVAPIDPVESTLFRPFIDAKSNKTWYGTPIVPGALEDLPKPEQYDANTSAIGKALGKATENLPKELQISPKKADYIIDAETGIAGDVALPMLTPSRQGGGGPLNRFGQPLLNVPKRAFTIDSTTQNDLSSRFYDEIQTATTNSKSAKATDEDAKELKRLNEYKAEASDLTKAITDLQNGNRPTKQADIRGLQKVRNQIMQDALDGKPAPTSGQKLNAVQKYVGTTYAINNFGSSADKEAMQVYGAAKYGKLSEEEMTKRIDADTDFYKGVHAIGELEDTLAKNGSSRSTVLTKAVALASVGADDDLFGAYQGTKKSRTETANKMDRARMYLANGGSTDEYVQLEKARKNLGKLSTFDKEKELDKINDQLAKGEIDYEEYYKKQGEINYNANISYVGLATSLAEANAPARGYQLYDIKAKNIQKGINLAAMGFTARDYREMAKAVDTDGNGYPSKKEIMAYVENSDVEDKATLFDALYYYKGSRNPFGSVTNYSRDQAAAAGKAKGVDPISNERGDIDIKDEESGKSGYGYRRRRYGRRWRHYGHRGSSKKATVPTPKAIKANQLVKGEALVSKSKSSSAKATPPTLKRVQAKIDLPTARKEY